jgi:O-antigen/teichoic acid export membrane protein
VGRTRFATRNYLTFVFLTAMTLLAGFAATPLLLRWLGEERFGAFRAVSDWYGYFGLLELGVAGSLMPLLARAIGSRDQQKVRGLLGAGIRLYLGIGSAMLLAGFMLTIFITHLVPVRPQYAADLRLGCLIGLANLLWLPLASPFRAATDAGQRSYWISLLLLVQSLLITTFCLWLAWKGYGITGQFMGIVAGGLVFNAALTWDGLKRYPGVLGLALNRQYDRAANQELWKLNTPTYALNMCGRISLLTDNIVVAAMLGPVTVVPLILTQRLAMLVQAQLQGIGNASWAGLAELHARGERNTFGRRVIELTNLTCILGVAGLVPIFVFNRQFVSLWVGGTRYGGEIMTLFAVLDAFLQSVMSLWIWMFTGTGQVRRVVFPLMVQTLLNFAASVLLTRQWGPVGPLVGTFIGFVAVTLWLLPLELRKTFDISTPRLLEALTRPIALAIPYGLGLWFLARWHSPHGWIELGSTMLAAAAAYIGVAWSVLLTNDQRKLWRERIYLLNRPYLSASGTAVA